MARRRRVYEAELGAVVALDGAGGAAAGDSGDGCGGGACGAVCGAGGAADGAGAARGASCGPVGAGAGGVALWLVARGAGDGGVGVGAEWLLEGVQAVVKMRGTVLWCGAQGRRCPFNWDGLAEGAWFAAYVRAYCPAGRYEPRGRSAVCAWARQVQDV